MSKAQFVLARELIKEKQYDDARALLVTIEHPLAAEWLAKLDRLAPQNGTAAPSGDDTFSADMPSLEDLITVAPQAKPAKSAAPKRERTPSKPDADLLAYVKPLDAEVAPVAPNAIPAPAPHTAFKRPGTSTEATPAPKPVAAEPAKQRNVQPKAAAGTKSAKATALKPANGKAAERVPLSANGTTALPVLPVTPALTGFELYKAWVSWLLLGTPPPNQDEKEREHSGPPIDDRTPRSDDEAVDWRNLPSRLNGGQSTDMPWLSTKIDARGSSYYGRVATLAATPAARGPAGDSMEWDFSGELPMPSKDSDGGVSSRFDEPDDDLDQPSTGKGKGNRVFDGLNLLFVSLFSFGVFIFIYTTRKAATPDGQVYSIGMEAAFIVFGLLLLGLGFWRLFGPQKKTDAAGET